MFARVSFACDERLSLWKAGVQRYRLQHAHEADIPARNPAANRGLNFAARECPEPKYGRQEAEGTHPLTDHTLSRNSGRMSRAKLGVLSGVVILAPLSFCCCFLPSSRRE